MKMERCLNPECAWNTGRVIPDDAAPRHYCVDCQARFGDDMPDADRFAVVGITLRDRQQSADAATVFIDATTAYGEGLVAEGLTVPDVVKIPVEIVGFSRQSFGDQFAKYGAVDAPGSVLDIYQWLYFVSEPTVKVFERHGIQLPPVLCYVHRDDWPQGSAIPGKLRGPIPRGNHVWERANLAHLSVG